MKTDTASSPTLKEKRLRIWELDFLRGFAIIMVVFDHIFADVGMFYTDWVYSGNEGLKNFAIYSYDTYFMGSLRETWRPVFLYMFFIISGMCSSFSKNNFLRGLKLALVSVILINGGTYLVGLISGQVEDTMIKFGVLHCFTVCIFFTAVIQLIVNLCLFKNEKFKKYKGYIFGGVMLIVCIIAFVLDSVYNIGYPDFLYYNRYIDTDNPILGMFIYTKNWNSNDYFPVLPWLGAFALGAALSPFIYKNKKSLFPALDRGWHKPISFCGRYSLFIYLISTVLCIGIYVLISYILIGDPIIF